MWLSLVIVVLLVVLCFLMHVAGYEKCQRDIKVGTPSASHNIPVAEIADKMEQWLPMTTEPDIIRVSASDMRRWIRQLLNR